MNYMKTTATRMLTDHGSYKFRWPKVVCWWRRRWRWSNWLACLVASCCDQVRLNLFIIIMKFWFQPIQIMCTTFQLSGWRSMLLLLLLPMLVDQNRSNRQISIQIISKQICSLEIERGLLVECWMLHENENEKEKEKCKANKDKQIKWHVSLK